MKKFKQTWLQWRQGGPLFYGMLDKAAENIYIRTTDKRLCKYINSIIFL